MSFPRQAAFFSARDEAKSSHSTLHTSHCTLRTPNFKLHTPHFTLHTSARPHGAIETFYTLRERSCSCKSQWNSIGNSSTSNTFSPIYIAGTIVQLQITMEFCRPHMHEKQLKPHLHCGNDPTVAKHNGIPSATHRPATLAVPCTVRERSWSCKTPWNCAAEAHRTSSQNRLSTPKQKKLIFEDFLERINRK